MAGLDEVARLAQRHGHALNEAGGRILNGGRSAFLIGDHLQLDVRSVHQVAAGDVPNGSVGRAAHLDLARMRLAVVDEAGQIGDVVSLGPLGVDGDGRSVGVDAAERLIILVGQLGRAEVLVGGELKGDHADGVAVRLSIRDGLMADDSAAAGAVVNRQRNAQILAHRLAEGAENSIRSAAGTPRADDRNTLGRVLRSRRDGSQTQNHGQGNHQSNKLLHNRFLLNICGRDEQNARLNTL